MKFRRLGKTGLNVSVVGVGAWQFGGEWGKAFTGEEVRAIVDAAEEEGINLIDTAECYGDHLSEELIGQAVAGKRSRWIIATKFGHKFHGHLNRTDERSADQVMQQLEDSLRALRTDYIDLYQYHSIRNEEFENQELRSVLEKALQSGKVRHIGNSVGPNHDLYQVERSEAYHVEAIQIVYNRLMREPEPQVFPMCQKLDLGVLARVPLASGFLSGKYRPGASFAAGDVRHGQDRERQRKMLAQVEEIGRKEVPAGVDMASWALAWCLKHPAVTCVIPGCKSPQQVRSNAAAAALVP